MPSRRVPDLIVSLFPSGLLADAEPETMFPKLWPIGFHSMQYGESEDVRLYDAHGALDLFALASLDHLLGDGRDRADRRETTMDRRVLQLIFKAAYHFDSHHVTVISGYREPGRSPEGRHGEGKAVDFQLKGVSAQALAAYLRTQARVGVGVYTHPRTQFVHLDNRDTSFHWLDASPPGRRWRERSLGRKGMAARDRAYRCEDDWPEGALPPGVRDCARPYDAPGERTMLDSEGQSSAAALPGGGVDEGTE